jgi:phosphoribosylanthranilate isomerase
MTFERIQASPSLQHPWIKVCGLRTFAELEACASAGVTHVGFNTWPRSPRCVEGGRVGVLVDAARRLGLAPVVLSLPGSLLPSRHAARLGAWLQSASPVPADERNGSLGVIEARPARTGSVSDMSWGDALLLDACAGELPGGTGKAVPLELALLAPKPFILAGGLNPDNVAAAVAAVGPAGVDAASGLESSPGVKDEGRIKAFCAAAREAFQNIKERSLTHRRGAEYAEERRKTN